MNATAARSNDAPAKLTGSLPLTPRSSDARAREMSSDRPTPPAIRPARATCRRAARGAAHHRVRRQAPCARPARGAADSPNRRRGRRAPRWRARAPVPRTPPAGRRRFSPSTEIIDHLVDARRVLERHLRVHRAHLALHGADRVGRITRGPDVEHEPVGVVLPQWKVHGRLRRLAQRLYLIVFTTPTTWRATARCRTETGDRSDPDSASTARPSAR